VQKYNGTLFRTSAVNRIANSRDHQPVEDQSQQNRSTLERRAAPGTPSSFLPSSGQLRQQNAVDELKVLCQPAGVELKDIKDYVYRVSRPFTSRVYVLDTGVDTSSEVSKRKFS
jgi:hypothetical protein